MYRAWSGKKWRRAKSLEGEIDCRKEPDLFEKVNKTVSPKGVVIAFEAVGVCDENIFPLVNYEPLVLQFIQDIGDGYSGTARGVG